MTTRGRNPKEGMGDNGEKQRKQPSVIVANPNPMELESEVYTLGKSRRADAAVAAIMHTLN